MRKLLLATAAALLVGGSAYAAPITGSINFDGNNTYSTTTHIVDFIGGQNAQSDTGDLAAFGTCFGCLTAQNLTYSPFSAVANEITGTNNGLALALDLTSISSVTEAPTFLALAGTALVHLTGFDATPGAFFFSTQGPQGPEVSWSASTLVPEPGSLAVLGVAVLGLVLARRAVRGLP